MSAHFDWLVQRLGQEAAHHLIDTYHGSETLLDEFIRANYIPGDPERQLVRQCVRACITERSRAVVVGIDPT